MPPATSPRRTRLRSRRGSGKPGPRTELLQVRATTAERLAIAQAALIAGISPTEFMRAHLLGAADRLRVDARPAKAEITRPPRGRRRGRGPDWQAGARVRPDPLLYDQVRRVGINLNQMMHHCHATMMAPPAELPALLRDIRALLAAKLG